MVPRGCLNPCGSATVQTPFRSFFFFQAEDGIRDLTVTGVQTCALPISTFVRYRTPQDSVGRWRVRDWGQPVTIGGVRVALGDIVVGDWDGVVVVPRRVAHEVLVRCEKLVRTENKVRAAVRRGMTPLDAYEKFGSF